MYFIIFLDGLKYNNWNHENLQINISQRLQIRHNIKTQYTTNGATNKRLNNQ